MESRFVPRLGACRTGARRVVRVATAVVKAVAACAFVAACADSLGPVATRQIGTIALGSRPGTSSVEVGRLRCTVTIADGRVKCGPESPSLSVGNGGELRVDGAMPSDAGSNAGAPAASGDIFGNQNTWVRLTAGASSFAGGVLSTDVTVQNLMNEAIGTFDGTVLAPNGIRVFFFSGPTATTGTGTVSVVDADGTFPFLGTDAQPYYQYNQKLVKDEVSAPKAWKFNIPGSVEVFQFTVLISTEVQPLLVINEVMANPAGATREADGDWFEVYNAGSRAVNMRDYAIADSTSSGRRPYHLINSNLVVPAGGYVVLGNSANTTVNGGVPVDYSYGGAFNLANSVDAIKLSRVIGSGEHDTLTINRTQYSNGAVSAQDGVSRELKNPALDNSNMDSSNWASALVTAVYGEGGRGTPKAQNSTYTP